MKDIRPATSKELRAWRIARGLSQSAMSKLLGVRAATISDWENGRKMPNLIILRLALRGLALVLPRTRGVAGEDIQPR